MYSDKAVKTLAKEKEVLVIIVRIFSNLTCQVECFAKGKKSWCKCFPLFCHQRFDSHQNYVRVSEDTTGQQMSRKTFGKGRTLQKSRKGDSPLFSLKDSDWSNSENRFRPELFKMDVLEFRLERSSGAVMLHLWSWIISGATHNTKQS